MKKQVFMMTALLVLGGISGSFAQRCGTTEYYKSKMEADPKVQQRMDAFETVIREQIARQQNAAVIWPSLPGFITTGNATADRYNYSVAKEKFLQAHPSGKKQTTQLSPSEMARMREQKRKSNAFTTVQGGNKR